ncbi:MAG: phosphoglycolate phosphatase [Xanthomonadales bacterium]|jgi:phosphoglycolate phosphatase|nr:phosphoglycolate phosphatase [Xanthomonadales bacterium]
MSPTDARAAAGVLPAAIVWDLDGTLAESAPDLATALNALLEENGRAGHELAAVRNMIGGGVPKLIDRGFRASGAPLEDAARDALVPRFMEIYSACATANTHLMPHALTALEFFRNAGVRQGLCTNKPIAVTRQIVAALGITCFFGSIIGGDSTPRRKPNPLPLQTCLAELGVSPEDAVMVGDSGADVGAARSAGVPIILVPDGYISVPARSLGADHVVKHLGDVAKAVSTLTAA